jgi:hypothetical protein
MEFKSIKRSTYERNKKLGRFEVIHENADRALVKPREVRGIYCNVANEVQTVLYTFEISREEIEAQDRAAHDALMARIRASKERS